MKTRHGFVSNSSTSSFLIYGVSMERSEFVDLLVEKFAHVFQKELDEINKSIKNEDEKLTLEEALNQHEFDIEYELDKAKVDMPLYMIDSEGDVVFFGTDPTDMGMDETKRQFQERVECEINTFFGKNMECSYINHDYCC